jgi:hypothetical protein
VIKRFKRERGSTKWLWLVLVVIGCILTIPAIALRNNGASAQSAGSALTASPAHIPTAREIKARSQYWFSKQGFAHGISSGAFTNAIAQVNEAESSGSTRRLAAPDVTANDSWDFLGPDPISLLTYYAPGVTFGSPHTGAGAFTAVAVDPQSGDIFAGSANGGLYLSADGGSTFSQVFNGQPSQAIGAIAFDTTTTPSTVYVGTGNPNGNLDDYYGAGVFTSSTVISGDDTWTQIMPASFANGAVAVSKIAIDTSVTPHIIFVGATWGSSASRADASIIESDFSQAGLWASSDGGSSWTQYAPSALGNCYFISQSYPCPVDDVEIDPAVNSGGSHNVYVAVDGIEGNSTNSGGVYRSTNEGATFASFIPSSSRSSIAIGQPTGTNPAGVAYFMIGDTEGAAFVNFWYSPDGNTLRAESIPSFSSGGFTFDGGNPNNQANSFYSQTLTVLPGTSNTVFFGGVGIYRGVNTGSNMNWQPIVNTTQGGAAANQHAFAYDGATAQMLLADDGGMYSFSPTSTSNVTFTSLNTTIDTTLVQSVGPNPTNNSLLVAGFQAAGTGQYQAGSWSFPTSEAGDGGFAMYDPTDPNYAYHTSSNDNWNIGSGVPNFSDIYFAFSKNANSITSPATWSSTTPSKNLIAAMKLAGDSGAAFYPPIAVDPTTSHRVFFGGHAIYVSNDGGTTWVLQANYDLTDGGCPDGSCALQDIEPVSHTNGWALSMADSLLLNDQFVLSNTTTLNLDTTNNNPGGTWSTAPTTTLAPLVPAFSTQATGIAVDHNNPNTAYLSLSGFYGGAAGTGVGHIYVTKDFGNTWAEADGGTAQSNPPSTALPDVPVLRVLVDTADTTGNTLYAATDIGVFQSLDGGNTWASFNLGTLQAAPVFDIEENQNNTIFIGTHGKGVFQLIPATPTPSPTPTPPSSPTPTPTPGSSPTPVPGALTVSPASIAFPATVFGSKGATSPPRTITVSNPKKGKNPPSITITGFNFANDANGTYTFLNNGCAATPVLSPNQKCVMTVVFTPSAAAKSAGSLTVDNNGTKVPLVKLAGTGVLGSLTASPKSLKFPATTVGVTSASLQVSVENKTAALMGVAGVQLGGKTGTTDYALTDTCSGTTIAAGGSCTDTLTFTPTAKGARSAILTVVGTTKAALNIPLSGKGK